MTGNKVFVVMALIVALGVIDTSSAASAHSRGGTRGHVVPCSLVGVNPVYHREIFGNPAVARSYGFVRSQAGTWQVAPSCRR